MKGDALCSCFLRECGAQLRGRTSIEYARRLKAVTRDAEECFLGLYMPWLVVTEDPEDSARHT